MATSACPGGEAAKGSLSAWPQLGVQEKRKLLHGLLERVLVRRSDGRSKDNVPVSERTQILLRGNALLPASADAES